MNFSYAYLDDRTFLKQLSTQIQLQQFVRISVLDWEENFLDAVEGTVSKGSLNVNGSSSMRRTANLQVVLDKNTYDILQVENLISLNKKVALQTGFVNKLNKYKQYDIIWIPLGIFVITGQNVTHSKDGIKASLQLKDKMCLLNGEIAGTLPAAITFSDIDTINTQGIWAVQHPTIYMIVSQLIHHFGGQDYSKMMIQIPVKQNAVLRWAPENDTNFKDKNLQIVKMDDGNYQVILTDEKVDHSNNIFQGGQDIGLQFTDFIWPSGSKDLSCKAGSTITSVLDTIVKQLGNYEYYYDVNGVFIFREIRNYLNTTKVTDIINKTHGQIETTDYFLNYGAEQSVFDFSDTTLISSYQNSPKIQNIKNDFIVWGKKYGSKNVAVRYHVAIDSKPKLTGQGIECVEYLDAAPVDIDSELQGIDSIYGDKLYKFKQPFKFVSKSLFPQVGAAGAFYYAEDEGITYSWNKKYIMVKDPYSEDENQPSRLITIVPQDWRTLLYLQGSHVAATGLNFNYYYPQLAAEWPKLYDVKNGEWRFDNDKFSPSIDYYLDFIDSQSEISKYSVSNIGRRSKIVQDNKVNCVFQPMVPQFYFVEMADQNDEEDKQRYQKDIEQCKNRGVPYTLVSKDIYKSIIKGGKYNSAFYLIRDLIYQNTSYNESITIQTIPIYYLQPNSVITVHDNESSIHGEYLIKTISLPLGPNGTSSISANKILQKF